VHRSITLSTTCALLICLVIVTLCIGAILARDLSGIIGFLFIAMLAFIGALVGFLREIFLATAGLRFGPRQH